MAKVIDARGLACPQPVILTKRALQEAEELTTIVDNEVARENVKRMAQSQGCQVMVEDKGGDVFHLHLSRTSARASQEPAPAAAGPTILFISADTIGKGSDELGGILMKTFISTIGQVAAMPRIILFMNNGVKLVTEGSPVLDDLRFLSEQGIDLLACGRCLDYFGIKEKVAVGKVSNMLEIAERLFTAGRIVSF
ncbi:MAG: sulfurtransferase-like selenium metabolism protein YedF [Chloroflexi bacterium]|nr:sulfurtransferase-like selenium metabolism protein YedF [Chloroflexota bacterium]